MNMENLGERELVSRNHVMFRLTKITNGFSIEVNDGEWKFKGEVSDHEQAIDFCDMYEPAPYFLERI